MGVPHGLSLDGVPPLVRRNGSTFIGKERGTNAIRKDGVPLRDVDGHTDTCQNIIFLCASYIGSKNEIGDQQATSPDAKCIESKLLHKASEL